MEEKLCTPRTRQREGRAERGAAVGQPPLELKEAKSGFFLGLRDNKFSFMPSSLFVICYNSHRKLM